jgi:acetolactate synthase-1/2/3 large subunit
VPQEGPASVAEALVERLKQAGVTHIFGVPGGECNLDLIAACDRLGIAFVLTRTETAAAIMACVAGELTGAPGAAMTTRGPGLASAVNGAAFADLDRSPLLLIADGYAPDQAFISHQRIDQERILAPLLRGSARLSAESALAQLDSLLAAAAGPPPGPSYLEVTGSEIRAPAPIAALPAAAAPAAPVPGGPVAQGAPESARALLGAAKRPLLIAGLQARSADASAALRRFVEQSGCPVLTTYKAKGAMPEAHPLAMGLYAGGVAEEPLVRDADLVLLYGFDPVEGPPQAWRYKGIKALELTRHRFDPQLLEPDVSVVAPIGPALGALAADTDSSGWAAGELARHRERIRGAARVEPAGGVSPVAVVDCAIEHLPADSRIAIDAGAHMLPVLHLWQCAEPDRSLISRGLSTMGFALPAAIGASLADPQRKTVAFTGDGGLMMCLGELGTALECGAAPVVVLFNDSALTLIEAKQRRRQLPRSGISFGRTDFARIAEGFGWRARRASTRAELDSAFREAAALDEPFLIDALVDPSSYDEIIARVRG